MNMENNGGSLEISATGNCLFEIYLLCVNSVKGWLDGEGWVRRSLPVNYVAC